MINFKPKYVHCFWNDELEGKKGFFADTIGGLKDTVESNNGDWFGEICKNPNNSQISYPFGFENKSGIKNCYQFCYYDPFYEMKVAYEEGKTIQYLSKVTDEWVDCKCRPLWSDDDNFTEYRIKPTEEEYQVVISFDAQGLGIIQSAVSTEFRKILFTGTKEECEEWVKNNYDISIVINGYFENELIVYKEKGVKNDPWRPTRDIVYNWDFDHYEYRINRAEESKEDKYVPFENTQELIEAWEKKCPANKDRPNGTMPLIWIKEKDNENFISLITDFTGYGVSTSYKDMSFDSLFEKYTFADGSVCGKRK